MTAGQKAAFTRAARNTARTNSPIGYQVAELVIQSGFNSRQVAAALGISDYQARGYISRVTKGDYANCRL